MFIHQSIDVKFEDLYVKYFRVLVFAREQDIARRGLRCWRRLWPAPDSASAKLGTFFITKPGSLSLGGRLPGPGLVLGRGGGTQCKVYTSTQHGPQHHFNTFVKLREREGQRVDLGRSLKGHLWMMLYTKFGCHLPSFHRKSLNPQD